MVGYVAPKSLDEVFEALRDAGGDAKILVGGTDLLVGARHGKVDPAAFVDLKAVRDLPEPILVTGDRIQIGPTLTMSRLAADAVVRTEFAGLAEAANVVGSVAIRNRATLVGNVCNASPAADTVPALLVHQASVTVAGTGGLRTMSLADFFLGPRLTRCGPEEVVVSLELPRPTGDHGSAFQRLTRRRGVDLASVSVAAFVDGRGAVRLGMGAVGPTALLACESDIALDEPDSISAALDRMLESATPISDVRAGRDYRTATLRVLANRAIATAAERRSGRKTPA